MGVAVGDPFGDGLPSLFVTNFGAEPNSFYRNVAGTIFEDAGAATGAGRVGMPFVRWGTALRRLRQRRPGPTSTRSAAISRRGPCACSATTRAAPRSTSRRATRPTRSRRSSFTTSGRALRGVEGLGRPRAACGWSGAGAPWRTSTATAISTSSSWTSTGAPGSSATASAAAAPWIEIEPRPGDDGRTVLGTRVRVTAGRPDADAVVSSVRRPTPRARSCRCTSGSATPTASEEIEITWPGGAKQTLRDLPARRVYAIRPGEEPQPLVDRR